MDKKRSIGVTLCGIYAILSGLFQMLVPFMAIGCSKIGIIILLVGIVPFVAGVGLLKLQNWARWMWIIFATWNILSFLIRTIGLMLHSGGFPHPLLLLPNFTNIIDLISILYLIRPKVKEQFR